MSPRGEHASTAACVIVPEDAVGDRGYRIATIEPAAVIPTEVAVSFYLPLLHDEAIEHGARAEANGGDDVLRVVPPPSIAVSVEITAQYGGVRFPVARGARFLET